MLYVPYDRDAVDYFVLVEREIAAHWRWLNELFETYLEA
jgi:hypothetical protein